MLFYAPAAGVVRDEHAVVAECNDIGSAVAVGVSPTCRQNLLCAQFGNVTKPSARMARQHGPGSDAPLLVRHFHSLPPGAPKQRLGSERSHACEQRPIPLR